MTSEPLSFNPYPGLRPFRQDEDHLFFGREEQIMELQRRLGDHRFVAVVGPSGSGKSSLVRCGLLSQLLGGKLLRAGASWEVSVTHPGGDPLGLLAESLLETELYDADEEHAREHVLATLSRSHFGLIEAVRQAHLSEGTNFLLVVDQFEEVFRFNEAGQVQQEVANEFVSLLLDASSRTDVPIYVVLTMRSDFIGDCGQFEGLAEAVNRGEFLIPRLTREQFKRVIEAPAKVAGGGIAPRLLQRLLNDLGHQADQLPCLQHALMRTWTLWSEAGGTGDLDLEDYRRVGQMSEALSLHADEVYEGLASDHEQELCAGLFRALTAQESEERGVRRPQRLGSLCEMLDAPMAELTPIINAYRQHGVTFLMPPPEVGLTEGTIIDISHESLMRVWKRLRDWVEEEAQFARIYRRLAETAALHADGKAALYHDPDLQIALSWMESHRPTAAWAERYHGGFDQALEFLDASRAAKRAEEEAREAARRRELEQARQLAEQQRLRAEERQRTTRRLQWLVAAMCLVAVVAVAASVVAWNQRRIAQSSAHLALASAEEARREKERAESLRAEADQRAEELRHVMYSLLLADAERLEPYQALEKLASCDEDLRGWEWHRLQLLAETSVNVLFDVGAPWPHFAMLPRKQQVVVADPTGNLQVRDMSNDGEFPVLRSVDVGFEVREVACSHDEAFVVIMGERFDTRERVLELRELSSLERVREFEDVPSGSWLPSGGARFAGFAVSPTENRLIAVFGGQGIRMYDMDHSQPIAKADLAAWCVDYAPDGEQFAVGGDGAQVFDADPAKDFGAPLNQITAQWVVQVEYTSDGKSLLMQEWGGAGGGAYCWGLDSGTRRAITNTRTSPSESVGVGHIEDLELLAPGRKIVVVNARNNRVVREFGTGEPISDYALDRDRGIVMAATGDGKTVSWSLRTTPSWALSLHQEALREIAVHPRKPQFASCSLDGTVRIWDSRTAAPVHTLLAHTDLAPTVQYSPDGNWLATGGGDRVVHLWDTAAWERVRTFSGSEAAVFWIRFSPDGRLLAGGDSAGTVHLWDVDSGRLLDMVKGADSTGPIEGLAFSPDGRYLVSGSDRPATDTLKIWDLREQRFEPAGELRYQRAAIRSLAFSPDGARLAAGTGNGILLFDWKNRDRPPKLLVAGGEVKSVFFGTGPEPRLFGAPFDGALEIWDPERSVRLSSFAEGTVGAWGITPTSDGKTLIVALVSGDVIVLPTGRASAEQRDEVYENIEACRAISTAWQRLGLEAASTQRVVDALRDDASLDESIRAKAIEYVESVVQPPVNSWLESLRAMAESPGLDVNEYQQAADRVAMILRQTPGYPTALLLLALFQYRLGDYQEALATIEQAAQAHQDWGLGEPAQLRAARVLILARVGRQAEARRELETAVQLDPQSDASLLREARASLESAESVTSPTE